MIQRSLFHALFLSLFGLSSGRLHGLRKNKVERKQRNLQTSRNLQIVGVAASTYQPPMQAGFAVDGNDNTRWQAEKSDDQWIYAQLGVQSEIQQVIIEWEAAYAKEYKIQISNDAQTWTDVYHTSSGKSGTETIPIPANTVGSYVRMYGIQRGTKWGYSIIDLSINGIGAQIDLPADDIPATNAVANSTLAGFPATNVINNNPNSWWQSDSTDKVVTLYVSLAGVHNFQQVILTWANNNYAKEYKIETSVTENPFNWLLLADETGGQGGTEVINVPPGTQGKYVRVVMQEPHNSNGYSLSEVKVIGNPASADVGQRLSVINTVVSSVDNGLDGQLGTDGDYSTRWASQRNNDNEFIYVELDQLRFVAAVRIIWESAYAKQFSIDTSLDGGNWTTQVTITDGDGGEQNIPINHNQRIRYVRMQGIERGTQWGYSLFEFEPIGLTLN